MDPDHSSVSIYELCFPILERLTEAGLVPPGYVFDQVIVNDYPTDDDEITSHVDRASFDDTIIGLSFGAPCVMVFDKMAKGRDKHEILLEEGSVLVFSGEARWRWKHGIAKRPHTYRREAVPGGRRTSVTFRRLATDSKLAESWGMNGLRFCNLPPLEKNAGVAAKPKR